MKVVSLFKYFIKQIIHFVNSAGRSRRQKSAKIQTREAALEKFKQFKSKGEKVKYELKEEDDVYKVVNEDEYADLVSKRQQDDWIVDDDGTGYYDDGREIFDDDLDDEDQPSSSRYDREKKKIPLRRNINKVDDEKQTKKKDIRDMFLAVKTDQIKKKSLDDVKLDEDELSGIVNDIFTPSRQQFDMSTPKPLKLQKKATPSSSRSYKSPLNPFANPNESSHEIGLTPKSIKKRTNAFDEPPLKRRSLVNEINKEYDFNDILKDDLFINDNSFTMMSKGSSLEVNLSETDKTNDLNESFEWSVLAENDDISSPSVSVVLPKDLPFESDMEGNQIFHFYWFDAFCDHFKNPGIVYLFGKVFIKESNRHVSCCIIVKNIERRIYLLPRETYKNDSQKKVTFQDVYNEFAEELSKQYKITEFRSRKVTKKYAFEKQGVPAEADYLEVLYPSKFQALPMDIEGNTFSHVFGTNTSSLEKLLIDCKMKGPSWLSIKNPEISNPPVSWCKYELIINKPNAQIHVEEEQAPAPEFTLVSLNLRTYFSTKTRHNEIIAISCLVNKSFKFDKSNEKYDSHFCAITKPPSNGDINLPYDFNQTMALKGYTKTKVFPLNSERELLNFFMARFHQIDPDIVVGHDIYDFDYELLLSRFNYYKIATWSKLGRLKRSDLPAKTKEKHNLAGRLVCDIKLSSKELIRAKSYDLTELSAQILRKARFEIDQQNLPNYYATSKQLIRLIDLTMKDNDLILNILLELNALPLALQITNIAGNLLSRTLLGGRSERNEYLLLHAFHEKNFICPDKSYSSSRSQESVVETNEDDGDNEGAKCRVNKFAKRKAAYTGGLVLEPKIGFYNRFILLMDFNSLYPSIIQEYNICFTTVFHRQSEVSNEEYIPELPSPELEPGILPTEIKKLVDSRREIKKLMNQPGISNELKQQYDIRQKAFKLTANSMYGCLGFTFSRFYAKPLAALVTFKGREILLNTKELVENIGLDVIYGDTDSIMILTNCIDYDDVKTIGSKIQSEVNRKYNLLEIDIDGVFRSMLLLKKKKYAALTVQKLPNDQLSYSKEVKGLDIVRRDWSMLARNAGQRVLDEILSIDKSVDLIVDNIHQYLRELATKIRNDEVPLEEFIISKALTRNPEDYNDKKGLPHVAVALRYNSSNISKKLKSGDTVPYIICEDTSESANNNLPATQRAHHPDQVKENKHLKVDYKYYFTQQIHPVVTRLVQPIQETNTGIIAEFLGIEHNEKNYPEIENEPFNPLDKDDPNPIDLDSIFNIFKKRQRKHKPIENNQIVNEL